MAGLDGDADDIELGSDYPYAEELARGSTGMAAGKKPMNKSWSNINKISNVIRPGSSHLNYKPNFNNEDLEF